MNVPPMVIPERLPLEIAIDILGSEQPIIVHLEGFKKSGLGWDEYATKKIDSTLRSNLRRVFREIRRNGFVWPVVDYTHAEPRLLWHQVVSPIPADLCTLCESKTCKLKEPRTKEEARYAPCWMRNVRYMQKLRDAGRIK